MAGLTLGAVPEITACFPDFGNGFAGRTIPEVRGCFGADKIGIMVFVADFARPIMLTVLVLL